MRRKDREVTDFQEIKQIVADCHIIHTAYNTGDYPYVVPTNYGYDFNDQQLTIYMHGAPEGRKVDLLKADPRVGFVIDDGGALALSPDDNAGKNSSWYRSVMGQGKISPVADRDEKLKALQLLLVHETGHEWPHIEEKSLNYVNILRIDVNSYTAKAHVKMPAE